MLLLTLFLAALATVHGEEIPISLALRAQTDFNKVEMAPFPRLTSALACVQAEAAVQPLARPSDVSLIAYRKGYCMLMGAIVTRDRSEFREAAAELDKAVAFWPARSLSPVSSGLRILADIAHLQGDEQADGNVKADLAASVNQSYCVSSDILPDTCRSLVSVGRMWLGWIAYRENRLPDAVRFLEPFPDSGWNSLVVGSQALQERDASEAVALLRKTVEKWSFEEKNPNPGILGVLAPLPDLREALNQLSLAQILAKDYTGAVATLDRATRVQPNNAFDVFLRGRAKELSGQAGLFDYQMASRVAFAQVGVPGADGQAHLYRGVWLYRRQDYSRAESEFASALNLDPGPPFRPVVTAWWHMAAVAGGACQSSAQLLDRSLASVPDYFPKDEAETLIRTCRSGRKLAQMAPR